MYYTITIMNTHSCEAVVVTCIDYRLQKTIDNWISENFAPKSFDRVAIAGGIKNLDIIMGQIEISEKLHHIKKVVLINHEDCGAYGDPPAGGPEKHAEDLKKAASQIKQRYPGLEVETYFLRLNGIFEQIS